MSFNDALDLLTRNCIDAFAEEEGFLYESASGASRQVNAVFDQNYQLVSAADGVASVHPVAKVHAKDFARDILEDDRFTHLKTGKAYLVKEVQPDSGYGVLVILHSEN